MFLGWMQQLQQQASSNPNMVFWDIITGDPAGTITVSMLFIAYVLYALAIIVFCFFYTLFGSVLYVLGPLVLALIPISGIGQLGKTYAVNLMIWNAWGILYAVFGALITAIHFNQVNNVLGNGFLGFLRGVPDSVMLGLVSVFYALAVALVPLIAKRIISGDVGLSAFALVRAGAVAAGAALAGVTGFSSGVAATSSGAASSAAAGAGGSSTSVTLASSMPPPTPATSMAGFLRSGMASAMNSDTNPAAPPAFGNGRNSGNEDRAPVLTLSSSRSGLGYRPHSVTQVITFNVARALGKAAGSKSPENN